MKKKYIQIVIWSLFLGKFNYLLTRDVNEIQTFLDGYLKCYQYFKTFLKLSQLVMIVFC